MNNKNLYKAGLLTIVSCILMIAAVMLTNFKYPKQSQGTLVFAESYKNGLSVNKIEISTPKNTTTLELKDNLWRVKEADDYYANTYLLSSLLTNLNTSTFYSRQDVELTEGTKVSFFAKDKRLDSVLLGKRTENGLYNFAKLPNGEVWLISGLFELPQDTYSWMLQPILELPPSLIETIRFREGETVSEFVRKDEYSHFSDTSGKVVSANELTSLLSRLWAENARSEKTFDKGQYQYTQQMEIVTFQGLVFRFEFFDNSAGESWINISLSTTPLPMTIINDYIRDNNFLYDGWYFQISPKFREIMRKGSLV